MLGDTFNGDVAAAFDALQAAVTRANVAAGGAVVVSEFYLFVLFAAVNPHFVCVWSGIFVEFAFRVFTKFTAFIGSEYTKSSPSLAFGISIVAIVEGLFGSVCIIVSDVSTVADNDATYSYIAFFIVDMAMVEVQVAARNDLSWCGGDDFCVLLTDIGGNF